MNVKVSEVFTNEALVNQSNLSPKPCYGPYNQLITDGYLKVDTQVFVDTATINSHFHNVLNVFTDGIETDIVQRSRVDVLFADGVSVKLNIFDYWFNLMMWELLVCVGDKITSKHLFWDTAITQNTIKDWIDSNFIDKHRTDIPHIQMNNFIDETIHKFKYIDQFSFYLMNTANNEDTIDLMKSSKVAYDAIHCDVSNIPPEDIKAYSTDWTNKLIHEMVKPESEHWARPYFMSKEGINPKQFREFMVNIGMAPDGEGSVFPYPLNANYTNGGVREIKNYIIDASKARASQEIAKMNVGTSGEFARIVGLNNVASKLHDDPNYVCNTKNFIEYFIKDRKTLIGLKHRWYRVYDNGIDFYMGAHPEKTHANLIGTTIYLRSPITCASGARGEGICYKCYGNLAYTNNNINIGRFAAEELTSQLTQKLLSAKHLLESSVRELKWASDFSQFFQLEYTSLMVNPDFFEKKYRLVICDDDIEQDDEFDQADYNTHITSCQVIDPKGNVTLIGTTERDNLYISPTFEEMIHRRKKDDDGNITFDLEEIKDIELFMIRIVNNELSLVLETIKNIINKKGEVERLATKENMLSYLVDTVNEGGLRVDTVHLEVILSNQCVNPENNLIKPEWEYKNEPYKMITLNEALRDNPSVTVSLMYKKIDKALFNPLTFKKKKASQLDLFYAVNPQELMAKNYVENTNIIAENDTGLVKPFNMNPISVKDSVVIDNK